MAVGPDEDGVIAGRGAVRDPPADLGGDPVRLLRARGEGLQPDGPGDRRDPLRHEAASTMPVRTSRRSGSLKRMSR